MIKKLNFIFGLTISILISCTEKKDSNQESLDFIKSEIIKKGEFEKVEFEFIGNPEFDTKDKFSTIRLKLYISKNESINDSLFGKQYATMIFNANENTKKFGVVLVSVFKSKDKNKPSRNLVFERTELLLD